MRLDLSARNLSGEAIARILEIAHQGKVERLYSGPDDGEPWPVSRRRFAKPPLHVVAGAGEPLESPPERTAP